MQCTWLTVHSPLSTLHCPHLAGQSRAHYIPPSNSNYSHCPYETPALHPIIAFLSHAPASQSLFSYPTLQLSHIPSHSFPSLNIVDAPPPFTNNPKPSLSLSPQQPTIQPPIPCLRLLRHRQPPTQLHTLSAHWSFQLVAFPRPCISISGSSAAGRSLFTGTRDLQVSDWLRTQVLRVRRGLELNRRLLLRLRLRLRLQLRILRRMLRPRR